jgi:NhaP-type Na+/H+ or K+/H+ antiporter
VVSSPLVPVRIRQALNVESGLNDGIALPVVLLLASFAGAASGAQSAEFWIQFAAKQVVFGPLVGIAVGYAGGRLIDAAERRGWMSESFEGLSALGIAIVAFVAAEQVHGNGFIAAFVAGLVFGNTVRHRCRFLFEFAEAEGQLLTLLTFLIFGAAMLPAALGHADAEILLYAVASLTLVRMLPMSISLIGAGLALPTHLFLGWFGPRGLASILFALLIVERMEIEHREEILLITIATVGLSALAHGLTAAPAARWYGKVTARMDDCEETTPVTELPTRAGMVRTQHDERGEP